MPTGRYNASALCLHSGPEAALVVGGYNSSSPEASRCAELLIHTESASGPGEGGKAGRWRKLQTHTRGGLAWRWRKLNPMHEDHGGGRGLLQLLSGGQRQRVLVAGGLSDTAEILQFSCSDPSDSGQWTRITPLPEWFHLTSLVEFNNRIFAIGSFLACITPSFSKDL